MNKTIIDEITKIPGYENKRLFNGAYGAQPTTKKMASRPLKYFKPGQSKVHDIDYILDATGLKDGMTISFHHCLRNGDAIMHYVISKIAEKGI